MIIEKQAAPQQTTQNPEDLAKLDELLIGAKAESDAYASIMRKCAVHVYRCGAKLASARDLARKLKIGWFSLLAKHGIAESTARQAIDLWRQVTDAGYTEEDIQDKGITQAKAEFGVIQEKKRPQTKGNEEGVTKRKDEGQEAVEQKQETGHHAPSTQPKRKDHAKEGESGFGEIGEREMTDLLMFRQRQLDEEVLKAWNASRQHPMDGGYLLFLLDSEVLWVENGQVDYLPDQDDGRDELVGVLADKLGPILEKWTTIDDIQAALKALVFTTEEPGTKPEPEVPESKGRTKRRDRSRRPQGRLG
jgi:hypothetical protein